MSDTPTPRESGAHDRARVFRALAIERATRLEADASAHAARAMRVRSVARGLRAIAEAFAAWERGEATIEQRTADLARWRDLLGQCRDLGLE